MARDQLIYGIHSISSALRVNPANVLEIWVDRRRRDARMNALIESAQDRGFRPQYVEARTLLRQVGDVGHQGVVARYRPGQPLGESDLEEILNKARAATLILVLDRVNDPHNLGACLRTSEAAGVHAVVTPKDQAARITPAVRKIACGAAERIPCVAVINLARTLSRLQQFGVWVYGLDDSAKTCFYGLDLTGPIALVLGAEGKGVRRLTRERCDELAHLPMMGKVESLNVSVAAGICLYETVRQRSL